MVSKNSTYEFYDFGFSPRENVFMTKVFQKYRIYKPRQHTAFAYMSQAEKKILLGDPTFKKRLNHLIERKALKELKIGKNPNNPKQFLYGYIPSDLYKSAKHHVIKEPDEYVMRYFDVY